MLPPPTGRLGAFRAWLDTEPSLGVPPPTPPGVKRRPQPGDAEDAFISTPGLPATLLKNALVRCVELYGLPSTADEVDDKAGSASEECRCNVGFDDYVPRKRQSAATSGTRYCVFEAKRDGCRVPPEARHAALVRVPSEPAHMQWYGPFNAPERVAARRGYDVIHIVSEGKHFFSMGEEFYDHPAVRANAVRRAFGLKLSLADWATVEGVGGRGKPSAKKCFDAFRGVLPVRARRAKARKSDEDSESASDDSEDCSDPERVPAGGAASTAASAGKKRRRRTSPKRDSESDSEEL